MSGRRKPLSGRLPAVAMLLVPLSLLWQGCEKQRTGQPVESVASSAETPRKADRPVAPPGKTTEVGPIEATEVTDAGFADFTAEGVVLADFWAERCPPCRVQGPIVDKLAGDFAGRAAVGKLDVDANRETSERFGIMYIPTLIIFKDGEEVRRFSGLQGKGPLALALEEALKGE